MGCLEGKGIQTWENGTRVEGVWKDGYLEGEFEITDSKNVSKKFYQPNG